MCDINVVSMATFSVLKTRLKFLVDQVCVVVSGVLSGFELQSLESNTDDFTDLHEPTWSLATVAAITAKIHNNTSNATDSPRARIARLNQNVNHSLTFFVDEVRLNTVQLKAAAQEVPSLLAASVDTELRPRLDFLRGRLNFTAVQLSRVIAAAPAMLNYSLHATLEPKLSFMEHRLRLTRPQVRKIVLVLAKRLAPMPPESPSEEGKDELTLAALNEVLRHLQSMLDITAPQLRKLVVSTPKLLGLSPRQISESLDTFRSEFGFAADDASKIVTSLPSVLLSDIATVLRPTLAFYQGLLDCGQKTWPHISVSGTTTSNSSSSNSSNSSSSSADGDPSIGVTADGHVDDDDKKKLGACLAKFPRLLAAHHSDRNFDRLGKLQSAVDMADGEVRLGPPFTLKVLLMHPDEFSAWLAPLKSFTMQHQSQRVAQYLATERLLAFYEAANRDQLARISEIIEKFQGKYDELFRKLNFKYKTFV